MKWKTLMQNGLLAFIVVGYILISGMVFHFIEGPNETDNIQLGNQQFRHFIANNSCVSPGALREFIDRVITLKAAGVVLTNSSDPEPSTWSFSNSVFFVITVVTSIGYGNTTPNTPLSQSVCVIVALFGLPLNLILLAKIGEVISGWAEQLASKLTNNRGENRRKAVIKVVILGVGGSVVFIFLPSIYFAFIDQWTYQTALYYSVITLSTIGFGDYVSGKNLEGDWGALRILNMLWVELGLAWFAALITSIQDCMAKKLEPQEHSQRDGKQSADIPIENCTDECVKTRL